MTLLKDITTKLPKSMYIPNELKMLFKWMEEKGFVHEENGQLKGYLLDISKEEHKGIYFSSENREVSHFSKNSQSKDRFYPIAYYGDDIYYDGCVGLWLDDDKEQHIVLVGDTHSVPMPFFVLGDTMLLLQLLSIGYSTILHWSEQWEQGLSDFPTELEVHRLKEYQKWFKETFNIPIPETAIDILPHFASINDDKSSDIFLRWDREQNKLWHYYRYTKILYDKINELFPAVNLQEEGFYSYIRLSLFGEVISWLERDEVDTTIPKVAEAVKNLTTWVRDIKQPEEDYGYTHLFTEFAVSFMEDMFHNRKLHHLIPYNIYTKEDVIKNKEFIMGYMSVSEEDYLHVLSLFDDEE